VLRYDTASCSTYERVSVLQCVAVCCSVLQCVAVRCSVVQCGVMFCSVLQYIQIYAYVYICIRNKNQRFSAAPQTLIANSVEGSYESPSASKRIADHSQEYICVYAHIQMYIYIYNKNDRFSAVPQTLIANSLQGFHESQSVELFTTNIYIHRYIIYIYICIHTYIYIYSYIYIYTYVHVNIQQTLTILYSAERWGAGVEAQKNVRGEVGGWGRVPFNEPYAPSLSTIYDRA